MNDETLHIAEIPYETGGLKYVYSRYLSDDGSRWIRHGLFRAFYPGGVLKSEGHYEHGREMGPWRDYHANGCLAAEGNYSMGKKDGVWHFWSGDGIQEAPAVFKEGCEVRGD